MKIGLILAGGMAKGAYQIGALKAIDEFFGYGAVKYIAAASVGTINGYALASNEIGMVENMWRSLNNEAESMFISEVIKSDYLHGCIKELTKREAGVDKFIFPLLTLHFRERRMHYIDMTLEEDAERRCQLMRASVAVPLFAKPIVIDGERYYDGAPVENNPAARLKRYDEDIDFYIAVYFDSSIKVFEEADLERKTLRICFDDGTRIARATYLTAKSVGEMIDTGKSATEEILSTIFSEGTEDIEYMRARVAHFSTMKINEQKRIFTSSRALTVINSITRHLLTHKPEGEEVVKEEKKG